MLALPSISRDMCEICGQKAIGNNFGAQSCRACAAFFRRNALSSAVLHCANGTCKPTSSGKFPCKKCRMEKCLEMGMDSKKFQLNRDVLNTASNFQSTRKQFHQIGIPQSMATFLGRPTSILCCEPDKVSHIKVIIDVSHMLSRVENILKQAANNPYSLERNSLQVLTRGFRNMRSRAPNPNLAVLKVMDKAYTLRIWEDAVVDTATWFTHFDEFRALPDAIQMTIVKSSWLLWSKLEHLAQTAEYLKRSLLSESILVIGNDIGIDLKDVDWDIRWMTNYTKEQIAQAVPIDINNNFATIVKWLLELEPSETELNYMLCQICLFMAAKRHPPLATLTERLLDIQADNLHAYYQKTLKGASYSARVAKMIKINNLLIRDAWLRNERSQVASALNLLCYEFSDTELFVGH